MIVSDSMFPMGEIFSNQSLWSVQFDKKVYNNSLLSWQYFLSKIYDHIHDSTL